MATFTPVDGTGGVVFYRIDYKTNHYLKLLWVNPKLGKPTVNFAADCPFLIEKTFTDQKVSHITYIITEAETELELLKAKHKPVNPIRDLNVGIKPELSMRLGIEKKILGCKPKHPIALVPGFGATGLEAWESPEEEWIRQRIWLSFTKLGQKVLSERITSATESMRGIVGSMGNFLGSFVSRKPSDKPMESGSPSVPIAEVTETIEKEVIIDESITPEIERAKWLKHLMLSPDGRSDPKGIKVRPIEGLSGVDYVDTNFKGLSYVFGPIIRQLIDVGYVNNSNLQGFGYDWRLDPQALEERDGYFTRMKHGVEGMREISGEKVLFVTHSMGYKVVHYFLNWIKEKKGQKWIDKNVEGIVAIVPPVLGAPKLFRSLVSGELKLDLDIFLSEIESRDMSRSFGSAPWLFPIGKDYHANVVEKEKTEYQLTKMRELLMSCGAKETWNHFKNYYLNNRLYLGDVKKRKLDDSSDIDWNFQENSLPLALLPPPVSKFYLINGVNLETEVNFYFRSHPTSIGDLMLDVNADKLLNSNGNKIKNGILYETRDTMQDMNGISIPKSGDGTVPYESLNYLRKFHGKPGFQLEVVELEGAQHRDILHYEELCDILIDISSGR
eukprot:TRINITY_DN1353_c0_g1_i2.p1 TRINITY_DN1353_c0_g1~~TRINITY_DN1353_c0_g1_i2.p1  ORF type:complete len:685 (-),score=160.67 TRINITY_DN1353_c0_g1_i2:31-1869(-)